MNVLESIKLFKAEMLNEIFHLQLEPHTEDSLVEAVKNVEQLVIETYEAEQNKK